jgi:hypothetical protein
VCCGALTKNSFYLYYKADLSVIRGVQRLPSGSMHRGEKVEVFVKTATFQTSVVVNLPSRAHYNVFKRNGGYNVFLNQQDIRANRKFRPVPLKGLLAVGLGTAEQKVLVYGDYSVTQLAPESLEKRFLDLARKVVRRPRLVRASAFDRATQMAVSVTMEQDVSASQQGLGDADAVYNITYVEIYVPYQFVAGYPSDQNWDTVFAEELAKESPDSNVPGVNQAMVYLANLKQDEIESVLLDAYEEFDAAPQEAKVIAGLICACVAEETGNELNLVEAADVEEHGLIGALVSDEVAEAIDPEHKLTLEAIGENIGASFLSRLKKPRTSLRARLAKAKARRNVKKQQKQQKQQTQQLATQEQEIQDLRDAQNAEIVASHIETIDASFRKYIAAKRNLAKKRSNISSMTDANLIKYFQETVASARGARASDGIGGDETKLAQSVLNQLKNRGIAGSNDVIAARSELTRLIATEPAARRAKRNRSKAEAYKFAQAAKDSIRNPSLTQDSASATDSPAAAVAQDEDAAIESPQKTAALTASLLQYQDVIRADKKNAIASGVRGADHKKEKLDMDISRIASVLSNHVEALCNDEKGLIQYEVIPEEVVTAFRRACSIHASI